MYIYIYIYIYTYIYTYIYIYIHTDTGSLRAPGFFADWPCPARAGADGLIFHLSFRLIFYMFHHYLFICHFLMA